MSRPPGSHFEQTASPEVIKATTESEQEANTLIKQQEELQAKKAELAAKQKALEAQKKETKTEVKKEQEVSNTAKIVGYTLIGVFIIGILFFIISLFRRPIVPEYQMIPQQVPMVMTGGGKKMKSLLQIFKKTFKKLIR